MQMCCAVPHRQQLPLFLFSAGLIAGRPHEFQPFLSIVINFLIAPDSGCGKSS